MRILLAAICFLWSCAAASLPDTQIKVVVLGPSGAGKSSLVHRWVTGRPVDLTEEPTLGAASFIKRFEYMSQSITLHIWDTAGQERFDCLLPMYFRGAHAVIGVYDVTDDKSRGLVDAQFVRFDSQLMDGCVKIVVGTKKDALSREALLVEELPERQSFAEQGPTKLGIVSGLAPANDKDFAIFTERLHDFIACNAAYSTDVATCNIDLGLQAVEENRCCCR